MTNASNMNIWEMMDCFGLILHYYFGGEVRWIDNPRAMEVRYLIKNPDFGKLEIKYYWDDIANFFTN